MNGLYGRQLTFRVEFPYPVASVQASAVVANHADSATGQAFLEYSLDNCDYHGIAETSYGSIGGEEFTETHPSASRTFQGRNQ